MSCAVIILGAGSGTRVGAPMNKVLLPLAGRAVIAWSVRTVLALPDVSHVVVTHHAQDLEALSDAVAPELGDRTVRLVPGGTTRHDSEWAALSALRAEIVSGEVDIVAIHDGARPLATADLFETVISAARRQEAALPGLSVPGLVTRGELAPVAAVSVQTPQAFRAAPLLAAYQRAAEEGFVGTDTAACWEWAGGSPVHSVPGEVTNLKITYAEDLPMAAHVLASR